MWDIIKLVGAMIFAALALPSKIIFEGMNSRRITTKGETIVIILGLWLITLVIAHFTNLPVVGIVAGYFFWAAVVGLFTVRPDGEFKEIARQVKAERKIARLEKRKGSSTGSNETVGKYEVIKLLERIEGVMVGSGFYKAEDQEKNPGYFIEDFYKVSGLQDNGDCIVTLILPPGKRSVDMDKFVELLPAGLDYHSAERFSENGDTAGIARFRVYANEPEATTFDFTKKVEGEGMFSAAKYIDPDAPVDLRNFPIGVMEDKNGGLLRVNAFQNHFLIGGTSGGGKSVTGAMFACQIAKTRAIIYGIDLKQTELEIMSDRFAAIAQSHEEALVMLRGLVLEMKRRNTYLKSIGATKLDINDPNNPPIVILIDEFAELMAPEDSSKETKEMVAEIDKLVRSISQLSRSVSFTLIIMTQSPKADIINTQLRNNLMNRIGLFTSTTSQLQTIIGEAALSVETIKQAEQAGWFVGGDYHEPVKFKTLFLTDEERKRIIRKYKGNRAVIQSRSMDEFVNVSWKNFVHNLVTMTDDGIGKMERIKDTAKLANELSADDAEIIYDYMVNSESFQKIMAGYYGGYDKLDNFVEAYEKRYLVNH